MGIIVDIAPRLILARKMRGLLKDVQLTALHIARRFIEETEAEITRQRIILYDQGASPQQVEEAAYALPLLDELLRQRRAYLAQLQDEFFGGDREVEQT